ncbi:hypothetical protein BH23CHL2_BH23CHL2_11900 [soil metagenome]
MLQGEGDSLRWFSRTFDETFADGELDRSELALVTATLVDDLRICMAEQAISTRCTKSAEEPKHGEHVNGIRAMAVLGVAG